MNKKFRNFMDQLHTLYDKYMVNREYKNRSFDNEDKFKEEQENLASQIDELEIKIKAEIEKVISEVFPHVEIIAYDSRYFNRGKGKFGNLLCKNLVDNEEGRTIQKYFEAETYFLIIIQRFEDLDEETQNKILNELNEK